MWCDKKEGFVLNNAEQKTFNQQCLYTALIQMLNKKSIDSITIGELCDYAGVSRMTYYRSYASKEEILLQHLEDCFIRFISQLEIKKIHTHYDMACIFFHFWQLEEKEFLSTLIRSGLSMQLMERFYYYLELFYQKIEPSQNVTPYVRSFLAGGLYKLLVDWIKDDCSISVEELAGFLSIGGDTLLQTYSK